MASPVMATAYWCGNSFIAMAITKILTPPLSRHLYWSRMWLYVRLFFFLEGGGGGGGRSCTMCVSDSGCGCVIFLYLNLFIHKISKFRAWIRKTGLKGCVILILFFFQILTDPSPHPQVTLMTGPDVHRVSIYIYVTWDAGYSDLPNNVVCITWCTPTATALYQHSCNYN